MYDDYKVYCYTSPSNKKYIGQTRMSLERRANHGIGYKSSKKFFKAIMKYGWHWFENNVEILKENLTKKEADFFEQYYIQIYDTINNGYNIQKGGEFNPADVLNIPIVGIQCSTLKIVFWDSAVKAAKELGINNKNISACLKKHNNGKTSGGWIWFYYSDWEKMSEDEKKCAMQIKPYDHKGRRKPVICVETQEVFSSGIAAAEKKQVTPASICACCKHPNQKSKSKDGKFYHWRYYLEEVEQK